jgi:hypothetical protein
MKEYQGALDLRRGYMTKLARRAYWIWLNQKAREGVLYTSRQFIFWYLKEYRKKRWVRAHVGRRDHSKPYSFDNVDMIEQAENNRERNARCGNPGKMHKKVKSFDKKGRFLRQFRSKVEAARFYGLSEKSVYNKCEKITADFSLSGPPSILREITFRWNLR